MNIWLLLLLALGLAMDAFAVSVTCAASSKKLHVSNALKVALFFGSFQAAMPVIGWLAGNSVRDLIAAIDHWIAFALLFLVGVRMISESFKEGKRKRIDPLHIYALLMLAIATSIDALAVGFSLSFIGMKIIIPVVIIGSVTFILSLIGFYFGKRLDRLFGNRLEVVGGFILIGIGVYIVIKHTL